MTLKKYKMKYNIFTELKDKVSSVLVKQTGKYQDKNNVEVIDFINFTIVEFSSEYNSYNCYNIPSTHLKSLLQSPQCTILIVNSSVIVIFIMLQSPKWTFLTIVAIFSEHNSNNFCNLLCAHLKSLLQYPQ